MDEFTIRRIDPPFQNDEDIFSNFHGLFNAEDELEYFGKVYPDGRIRFYEDDGEPDPPRGLIGGGVQQAPGQLGQQAPQFQQIDQDQINFDEYSTDPVSVSAADVGMDDDMFSNFYILEPVGEGEQLIVKSTVNGTNTFFKRR